MTELSPAAQAVLDTYNSEWAWRCWIEDGIPGPQFKAIAAALEAAVDKLSYGHGDWGWVGKSAIIDADKLLAIAAELRDQDQPSSEEL